MILTKREKKTKRGKKITMGLGSGGENPNKGEGTYSSSSTSNNKNNVVDQFNVDARLFNVFKQSEESGESFPYSETVKSTPNSVSEQEMTTYLSKMQRGGLVQPFGCMIVVAEHNFTVIAYSDNTPGMLDITTPQSLLGLDARILFTTPSGASLAEAAAARDLTLFNPVWVFSRYTGRNFYAILHRSDVGIGIDLEPARHGDPAFSVAGAVKSQKLALRAISRLQAVPVGDIGVLCDAVVEKVQELTGYDRVMVYKFHDDGHGEVLSEIRRSDLEPYLGLHYPAADIPQVARFLFKQNRVRMIYDCQANPVAIIQSEKLTQPLCLVSSTLRAPHGCHIQYMKNMGETASLVMAIIVNGKDQSCLWGLVACHHDSPRYVPFPLRYACEFLVQAFGLQVNMELKLEEQIVEKKIMKTRTLLCDMLLRDTPFGVVTQSPNIMDLVKCDGAALLYRGRCWLLGVTPTEKQMKDIASWLITNHGDSTGFSTDCLADAGYHDATLLSDAVCGMIAAKIMPNDFLFWFRSQTAKEMKWAGAKHFSAHENDGEKMHPRSSFKAFLEVVKNKSLPWEDFEINAIHSLQLIMRGSLQKIEDKDMEAMAKAEQMDFELRRLEELRSVACEMAKIIETATTIFATDCVGLINGWNAKTAELTGLATDEAMGKSLINELVIEDSRLSIKDHISRALQDEEVRNLELKLKTFGLQKDKKCIIIMGNSCTSKDCTSKIVGVCFVGQDVTETRIVMDKFVRLQGDYTSIVQSLNPLIPPIFASDENVYCTEWNAAMEKLTGWKREEIIGKILFGEIFGDVISLEDQDALINFMVLLHRAIEGHDTEIFPFGLFDKKGKFVEVSLTVNKRTDANGCGIGCFCFLQALVPNLEPTSKVQTEERGKYCAAAKELAYIRQEIKNPLNGMLFTRKLMETKAFSDDEKQLLNTSCACERQMLTILEDVDLGIIQNGSIKLNMESFLLESVLDASISQVMITVNEKKLPLSWKIPNEVKMLSLYGDQIRLQQILADFLLNIICHTPSRDGWVKFKIYPSTKTIENGVTLVQLQFRMTHSGGGLPVEVVKYMLEGGTNWTSEEGLALNMACKLVKMMNGDVNYVRKIQKCYLNINLKFPIC